jgi:hypothetical protein
MVTRKQRPLVSGAVNELTSASANGAGKSFATPTPRNGHRGGVTGTPTTTIGNGPSPPGKKAPDVLRRSGARTKSSYLSRDGAQTKSGPDLFGPPDQWCRASEVWSLEQWQALCAILFNGNENLHEFLVCHLNPDPAKQFSKAYGKAVLDWHIDETYRVISSESARPPSGIGFYPYNALTRCSYWGGLDFDAHENQSPKRARALAAKAVRFAHAKSPTLKVIACTSGAGGGWHVWFFSRTTKPIAEWSVYLRKVAAAIGANIGSPDQGGDCELRPNETDNRPFGLRAPGSLNPKDGSFGLIALDSLTAHLDEWESILPIPKVLNTSGVVVIRDRSFITNTPPSQSLIEKQITWKKRMFLESVGARYAIRAAHTRHRRLVQMVGAIFHECGRSLAMEAAVRLYQQARPRPQATLKEHVVDFSKAWSLNERRYYPRVLSSADRVTYKALDERDRAAFRVFRNWARHSTDYPAFDVNLVTLAARLDVNGMTASRVRQRFCGKGIMRLVAKHNRAQHRSARYQWLVGELGRHSLS